MKTYVPTHLKWYLDMQIILVLFAQVLKYLYNWSALSAEKLC